MNYKKFLIIAACVMLVAGAGLFAVNYVRDNIVSKAPQEEVTGETSLQETEEAQTEPDTESTEPAETSAVSTTAGVLVSLTETTVTVTVPSTTAAPPATTKPVTAATKPVTTKPVITTTAPVTQAPVNYEGTTEVKEETQRENLKYGVVRSVTREVVYAVNGDGSRTRIGTQNEATVYNRLNYSASYNDLLPAAKQNAAAYESYINEVLRLTNKMRADKGLAPLKLNSRLVEQANVRAEEIAWSGKHSHSRPGVAKFYTTIFRENGITHGTCGENIGWGYSTPLEVCNAWRNSETHYENIINPEFTEIGIGIAPDCDPAGKLCWVQHFHTGV